MTVADDLATLREALRDARPRSFGDGLGMKKIDQALAALARVEAEIARLERETDMIDLFEFTKRRAEARAEAAKAEAARLRDGLRACGEHLEHCCRTDIGWREQTRSHDAATKALHAAEDGAAHEAPLGSDDMYPESAA